MWSYFVFFDTQKLFDKIQCPFMIKTRKLEIELSHLERLQQTYS